MEKIIVPEAPAAEAVRPARFLSLDVFRGLTVAGMILVNTPGSWEFVYAPLLHAPWDGCTPTDLVFPFFLFAVGNALAFALGKYQALGTAHVLRKLLTRTLLIFGIGLLLNWFPFVTWEDGRLVGKSWEHLRVFGVLQRIALAYLGGALVAHFFRPKAAFAVACGLLLAYWGVLSAFGDLTLEGNAVRRLDVWLLGENHLYKGYFSEVLGRNIAFDPEGLLGALPAAASVVFGFLAGRYIRQQGDSYQTLATLFALGGLAVFAGLCWHPLFPINKPLWSGSYVLHTTGLALTVLAAILLLVEKKGYRAWTDFFVVFGKNPLFIFVLSGVWVKLYFLIRTSGDGNAYGWLYEHVFRPLGGDYFGSLLFALAHVVFFWAVGKVLDRRKIYIRV